MVYYSGPASDHFDGRRFHNTPRTRKSFKNLLAWQLNKKPNKWPLGLKNQIYPAPQPKVAGNDLQVTFVNHATTLIQTQGINILTDPIWSKRPSPIKYLGPKRVKQPGIPFEQLPPIDIVLISHDHYDHLDLPTLKMLKNAFDPCIYTGLGVDNFLKNYGFTDKCYALDWWQGISFRDHIKINFVPAKHWSGRRLFKNVNTTLWGGFVLETAGGNIYFAGDTAYCDHFSKIRKTFANIRFAMLPIGAYEPRWFMQESHINPYEAVKAHIELAAEYSLAIHFGTFKLSDEGYHQPVEDLKLALQELKVQEANFRALDEGESWLVA